MSLGPGCDSPASLPSRGPCPTHRRCPRRGRGSRVLGSQMYERRRKSGQVGGEDAASARSVLSDQISDRDAVRWGGKLGAPGDSQGDLRWSAETNRTSRHVRTVSLCAHNPEVAGSNPAPATNSVNSRRPLTSGPGLLLCRPLTCGYALKSGCRTHVAGLVRPQSAHPSWRSQSRSWGGF